MISSGEASQIRAYHARYTRLCRHVGRAYAAISQCLRLIVVHLETHTAYVYLQVHARKNAADITALPFLRYDTPLQARIPAMRL